MSQRQNLVLVTPSRFDVRAAALQRAPVIEDFADYTRTGDAVGREWAVPHRWAVATNEGTLIFVDDPDITEHSRRPSTT